ncbi:restriction endonuclease fold toxin-2 domain-containing protein [Streptomyces virginiae]|uniref:restriction endonuclease fold toxin-2 domain-containing protein n=1 Tax=Streptomyces virginiae TaxID=1961 RepID=UPI00365D8ACF
MKSLTPGGFAGGVGPSDPDNAYQLRTSGYPERVVPLAGKNRGLMVDGKDNAAYWQSMMAMSGTPGSTRYVP